MSFLSLLTISHVAISLIAIVLGIPAIRSISINRNQSTSVVAYFLFTALTTLTGFAFPIVRFTPGLAFGLLTVGLLVLAIFALRKADANYMWHYVYLLTAVTTLYLNCIVLIVQSFQKIPVLRTLAPTQTEAPFLIAQAVLALAILFVIVKGYRTIVARGIVSNR